MQSDLIGRSKLKSAISREDGVIIGGYRYIRASAVMEKINASPGVDAVEVVRCGECAHRENPDICPMISMCGELDWSNGKASYTVANRALKSDFCSKGTKMEGDRKVDVHHN